jgi:hypothetical protein
MSETWSWNATRKKAIEAFGGEMPNAQSEEDVVALFRERPVLVDQLIDKIAERKLAGRVNSGWAILRKEVVAYDSGEHLTVTDSSEREHRITVAEIRIRNALIYCDREDEVEDELCGGFGLLRAYADDELLVERMLALWREQRQRGERAEQESNGRADRFVAIRARLAQRK